MVDRTYFTTGYPAGIIKNPIAMYIGLGSNSHHAAFAGVARGNRGGNMGAVVVIFCITPAIKYPTGTAAFYFFVATVSKPIENTYLDVFAGLFCVFMQSFIDSNTGEAPFVGAAGVGVMGYAKESETAHSRDRDCP